MANKMTLENFGTIKIAHIPYGKAVLLNGLVYLKTNTAVTGDTVLMFSFDTGRIEEFSQHLLCLEVDLDITVRLKKKLK